MTDPAEALKLAHQRLAAKDNWFTPSKLVDLSKALAQALIDRMEPVEAHLLETSKWWICPCGEVIGDFDGQYYIKFCPNCGKAIKYVTLRTPL